MGLFCYLECTTESSGFGGVDVVFSDYEEAGDGFTGFAFAFYFSYPGLRGGGWGGGGGEGG